MNRVLFAVAVGVVSLGMMGCATNVDDPVPPTPAPEPQRDPPKQVFSAQLQSPEAALISQIGINDGTANVPAKQKPPIPEPFAPSETP
jgi:hypothetical protein